MVMMVSVAALSVVMMVLMLIFIVMMAAFSVVVMFMLVLVVMMAAFSVVVVFVLVLVMMVMAALSVMVVFVLLVMMRMTAYGADILPLHQFLGKLVFRFHCRENLLSPDIVPRSGNYRRMFIKLPYHANRLCKLFFGELLRAAENDSLCALYLIFVKFAEILHIHPAFVGYSINELSKLIEDKYNTINALKEEYSSLKKSPNNVYFKTSDYFLCPFSNIGCPIVQLFQFAGISRILLCSLEIPWRIQ